MNNTGLTAIHCEELIKKSGLLFPELQYLDLIQEHSLPINFSKIFNVDLDNELIVNLDYAKFKISNK